MRLFLKKILNIKIFIPVIIGVLIGWLLYGLINFQMYQLHYSAIDNVKASEIIIDNEDVALKGVLNHVISSSSNLTDIEDFTYRVSKYFGLIKADDDFSEVAGIIKKGFAGNKELLLSKEKLSQGSAASLFLGLVSQMGAVPRYREQNPIDAESALMRLIGKFPRSLSNYDLILRDSSYENAKRKGYFLSYFNPFVGSTSFSNQDIIERLLTQYRLSEQFIPINNKEAFVNTSNSLASEIEYKQTKELINRLIFNWLTNEEVASTKNWIMVFNGPMQLIMFMLFFIAIFILFLPIKIYLKTEADITDFEEKRSELFIFCEETMPVLGFIGTIMGLMLALGDAYKIPIASAGTGSALAISSITNTLAMAFTTTLMAFTLKIILDLIKLFSSTKFDFITKKENTLIDSLVAKLNFLSTKNE